MKLKLILILLLSPCFLLSQTTEEEYLYVTYGYKEQLLKGLDDKKGYAWKQILEYKFVYDNEKFIGHKSSLSLFTFEGLYRSGESRPCAIVSIYRKDENIKKRDGVFICLPHPKSDSGVYAKMEAYFKDKVDFNAVLQRYYILALSKLAVFNAQ